MTEMRMARSILAGHDMQTSYAPLALPTLAKIDGDHKHRSKNIG